MQTNLQQLFWLLPWYRTERCFSSLHRPKSAHNFVRTFLIGWEGSSPSLPSCINLQNLSITVCWKKKASCNLVIKLGFLSEQDNASLYYVMDRQTDCQLNKWSAGNPSFRWKCVNKNKINPTITQTNLYIGQRKCSTEVNLTVVPSSEAIESRCILGLKSLSTVDKQTAY